MVNTFSEFMIQIGNNIRKHRESKDIKQDALAKAIGISNVTLSKIENGKDCSILILEKISNFLKLEIYQIVPNNVNSFNFTNSPNSNANGNYYNNPNDKLIDMLKLELEQKNLQIHSLINK